MKEVVIEEISVGSILYDGFSAAHGVDCELMIVAEILEKGYTFCKMICLNSGGGLSKEQVNADTIDRWVHIA